MQYAFSDGSPLLEYLTFLLILLVASAAFVPAITRVWATDKVIQRIANFSRRQDALSEHGLVYDLRRIDLFRIAVGGMAFLRYGQIFLFAIDGADLSALIMSACGAFLGASVMVGFLTPAATFFLMSASNLIFDNYLGSSTLGTMVMSICLIIVLLAPGGLTLSVDSVLVESRAFSRTIGALRCLSGAPSEDRVIVAKLSALFSYFCVCLYSVAWHTTDEAWMSGLVIAWVMLSPIANPSYAAEMWAAYNYWPWLFVAFSRISIGGMFAWYVLTLPGLFMGQFVRTFVIVWGLLFFLISALVLPLAYLGWYELAFWFVLFASGKAFGSKEGPEIAVLFDDRCNLCDRTVRLLARIDLFGRIEFRPIRRNIEFANANGVTLEEGLTDLVGISLRNGKRVSGFLLYYTLSRNLVALWVLRPVLWLSKLTGIGPVIYRAVADRRTKLFGVCEFSNIPDRYISVPTLGSHHERKSASPMFFGTLLTLAILSSAFLIRLPIGTNEPENRVIPSLSRDVFGATPAAFGIHKINVFNTQDLSLFRFTNRVYFYDVEHDLSSSSPLFGGEGPAIVSRISDAQRYDLTRQMRRMSRVNFGCDRDFIEATLPTYRSVLRARSGELIDQDLVLEFSINAWPTSADLRQSTPLERRSWPLCRYLINLEEGTLKNFSFVQSGLDEAIRQKGFPAILPISRAEAASEFPCAHAAYFTGALAGDQIAGKLARDIDNLKEDRYGRFGSDCFLETWGIMQQWPDVFASGDRLPPRADVCELGLALLGRLYSSSPAGEMIAVRNEYQRAKEASLHNDNRECVSAAYSGWASYWREMIL